MSEKSKGGSLPAVEWLAFNLFCAWRAFRFGVSLGYTERCLKAKERNEGEIKMSRYWMETAERIYREMSASDQSRIDALMAGRDDPPPGGVN